MYKSDGSSPDDIHHYLNSIETIPKVSEKDLEWCDKPISFEELSKAVNSLKCNKSPGLDGLTSDFYKTFWHDLKDPFMGMLNESSKAGSLPTSLSKAIITLLFKSGDKQLVKNYRPISLCNYDYKIIASVLAMRLQKIIPKLVSFDQFACIKGRHIGSNARFICDIIEYCENFNIPGVLISLDFQKSFDSVEWNFMEKTLAKFGFGPNFQKWVKILYTNPTFVMKNNG